MQPDSGIKLYHTSLVLHTVLIACILQSFVVSSTPSFLGRLIINGCPVSVLDLGPDNEGTIGQRVWSVEPLMCVAANLSELQPRFDPVSRRTYLSVPVLLADEGEILINTARQLGRPDAGQFKYASIGDITVMNDADWPGSSPIVALDFVWTPPQSVGFLWLGCRTEQRCDQLLASNQAEAIEGVLLTASLLGPISNISSTFNYRLTLQSQAYFAVDSTGSRSMVRPPNCRQLRAINLVDSVNCTFQMHRRLDRKGHYLVEPLLCYRASSLPTILVDNIRHKYYLQLDLLLTDGAVLNEARRSLEQLRPISVEFMRIWLARAVVDEEFSRQYQVGPLLIATDGRSARVRVHCNNWTDCSTLRCAVKMDPIYLWRHIKWTTELTVEDSCLQTPSSPKHSWQVRRNVIPLPSGWFGLTKCVGAPCKYVKVRDGNEYVVLMQRLKGSVSFQRNWDDYEKGFGDESDFWLGLAAAHKLSSPEGINLRMELKLWNGSELFGEFANFRIENASFDYRMTYSEMLANSSNIGFDPMDQHNGMKFSTVDRDNDANENSCSKSWSHGGWWFNSCYDIYPTGLFPTSDSANYSHMILGDSQQLALRGVRLLLQVNMCQLSD